MNNGRRPLSPSVYPLSIVNCHLSIVHATPPPSLGTKMANFEAVFHVVSTKPQRSYELTQHVPRIEYEFMSNCCGRNTLTTHDLR